ncbi:hypothetical protein BaRGS_00025207, partial [Batillaria attramentaria]
MPVGAAREPRWKSSASDWGSRVAACHAKRCDLSGGSSLIRVELSRKRLLQCTIVASSTA